MANITFESKINLFNNEKLNNLLQQITRNKQIYGEQITRLAQECITNNCSLKQSFESIKATLNNRIKMLSSFQTNNSNNHNLFGQNPELNSLGNAALEEMQKTLNLLNSELCKISEPQVK